MFRLKIISQTEWNKLARAQFGIEHIQAEWQLLEEELNELAAARAQAPPPNLKNTTTKSSVVNLSPTSTAKPWPPSKPNFKTLPFKWTTSPTAWKNAPSKKHFTNSKNPTKSNSTNSPSNCAKKPTAPTPPPKPPINSAKKLPKPSRPPHRLTTPANPTPPQATHQAPRLTRLLIRPLANLLTPPTILKNQTLPIAPANQPTPTNPAPPNPNFTPSDKPGPNAPPAPSGDNPSPTAPPSGPGLPGVRPTLLNDFVQRAQDFQEPGDPFSQEVQQERRQTTDDLRRMQMADEMAYHGERIRAVIIAQHELASKLNDLQWDEPQDLTAQGRERLAHTADQERELRDELEDAALMLRETAELTGSLLPKMSNSAIAFTEKLEALGIYPDLEAAADYAALHEGPLTHRMATTAAHKLEALLADQGQPGKPGNGLDGSFNLPKASIANALKPTRPIPQPLCRIKLRQRIRQWQRQRQPLHARPPTRFHAAPPTAPQPAPAKAGMAPAAPFPTPPTPKTPKAPNNSTPTTPPPEAAPAIAVPGVPARYQNLAAQYFRRLANDAKRQEETRRG